MRFLTLMLIVLALVAVGEARRGRRRPPAAPSNNCKGKPVAQVCEGPLDVGNARSRRCRRQANDVMWHYNAAQNRTCVQFKFLGCGGNRNRYCTKLDCETKCRR